MENIHKERISALRSLMMARGWDAVVITGSDPHGSEYPAARWKQVEWLSGFTGEAGDMVITEDHAGLWTDTRYFIQANRQLEGTGAVLHKTRVPEQVLIPEWLREQLGDECVVAVDGLCVSADYAASLPGTVVSIPNLLDVIWKDRPQIPQTSIVTMECGVRREDKIGRLRDFLAEKDCDGIIISSLDEIAWLLNIRASDIEYNPMSISYLLVGDKDIFWYVTKDEDVDETSAASFSIVEAAGVDIRGYDEIDLLCHDFEGRLYLDCSTVNYNLYSSIVGAKIAVEEGPSPIAEWKAVKNPVEIEGMKRAHLMDGAAMENFLYWVERCVESGREISERDAADKLGQLRSEIAEYRGDSFETISAYGEGAALPHYITPQEDAPLLRDCGLYLCDSGGQFTCGTTDITRTVPLGKCTALEKEDYTLVLKGHIDLAMAVFPEGTPGCRIDALAREPLWRHMRNFGHGTGHGVGYWLGVHEGPQDIRQNLNPTPLQAGMITSDEPGLYREGKHGVRHENLLLCVDAGSNEFGHWLKFEPLTLCHFDTSILLTALLDKDELDWLDAYNEHVYRTLSPLLSPAVSGWLREKTRPIGK